MSEAMATGTENATGMLEVSNHLRLANLCRMFENLDAEQLTLLLRMEGLSTEGSIMELRERMLRKELERISWSNAPSDPEDPEGGDQLKEPRVTLAHEYPMHFEFDELNLENEKPQAGQTKNQSDKKSFNKKCQDDNKRSGVFDSNGESDVKYRLTCMDLLKTWNLQFQGLKGTVASDFLEYLKDFRKFANISDALLLDMLLSILDCNTRIWYRSEKFSEWREFEKAFNVQYINESG